MIPISDELKESLSADTQIVRPKVTADLSDLRSLNNLKVHSSSHTYRKQVEDRDPITYLRMDRTDYGAAKKIRDCIIAFGGAGQPLIFQMPNHGLSPGDEIVFETEFSGGLPYESSTGNIKAGEHGYYNRYYMQNAATPSSHYFRINTIRANAISNSSTGRVVNTAGGVSSGISGVTVSVGKNALFTYASHGLSNGDCVVLYSSGTIAGGLSAKTDTSLPLYYVQNATSNTFNLNTNKFNAINGLSDGIADTTSANSGTLYCWPIHKGSTLVQGGHRIKDYGSGALEFALGTSSAGVPIYDQTIISYHDALWPHTEIIDPVRAIDTFFREHSDFLFNRPCTAASPAVITDNSGLAAGTSIKFADVGTLTGINTTTIYYIQNPTATNFRLNTTYIGAITNSSTGRVNTGGVASNVSIYVYDYPDIGFFSKYGSSDTSGDTVDYYSWSKDNSNWTIVDNKLTYKDEFYSNLRHYATANVGSLDHFIDFKVGANDQRGIEAYVRFVDKDNFVSVQYASPSYSNPITIQAMVNGQFISYYEIPAATHSSFSSSKYYRFQAKGNTFLLYDMGTSEPTNSSTGTLLGSTYCDHPILRTDDATKCGLGFAFKALLNPMAQPGDVIYTYDYAAVYGWNYLSGTKYFNYDGTINGSYAYASTALDSNSLSGLQTLNQSDDFSYTCWMWPASSPSGKHTIFWLGNAAQATAIRMYYSQGASSYIVAQILSSTTTYTLTSSALSITSIRHISLVKDGDALSLYIDGVLNTSISLPTNFALKDIVTGSTPYMTIGADYAGTTLGDTAGYRYYTGYIGEFASFAYALNIADIKSMYYSVANGGDLYSDTVDKYCNAECAVDGQLEETFTFAFANLLNNKGTELKSNNSTYSPNPIVNIDGTTSIEDNYGWMSRVKSDAAGDFASGDFFQMTFDSAKCNKIFLSTGYLSGPINEFDFVVTKSDSTEVSGSSSFGGQSYKTITSTDLGLADGEYLNIISIKITPTSTVNPYDYARLFCVNPIWNVDLSDYVVSFNVDKIRDNFDASLPIGATAANNGSLTLDNTDRVFNIFGASAYGQYAVPDVPFYISFEHNLLKYQTVEEIPLASEMYADTWSFDNSSMTVQVALRDYSKYIQEKTIAGYVGQGISAGRGIMDLMLSSGFPRRKIVYIDKYDDTIFIDNPKVYVPFNETYEQFVDTGTLDQCQYTTVSSFANYSIGKSLLYSEIVYVQDEVDRKSVDGLYSTFEPYYRQASKNNESSMVIPDIAYSTESWTTEIFHYVDLSTFTSLGVETQLIKNEAGLSDKSNYKLFFEVNGNEIVYTWAFDDTSDVEHRITSSALNVATPHQVVVRKTGGSPNKYELIIDGVIEDTMSPAVNIKNSGSILKISKFSLSDGTYSFYSNFSFYDYALDLPSIINHYIAASVSIIPTYRYLYASDETYWDAMLSIATADLGMFYIDEYGIFRYEYRNFIHESLFERYQNSQYNFADDTNIVSGAYISEIQTNKISVAVKKISIKSNETQQLWSASDGESLVTAELATAMSPQSISVALNSVTDPLWTPSGYVKIDDEIIKYKSINGSSLVSLERGAFGTSIAWHEAGAVAREARHYVVQFSSSPAASVKYPLLTNESITIDRFSATANSADIVISCLDNIPKNAIYLLSGTDPSTNLADYFVIAGVPVGNSSSEELLTQMSSELSSNIRRYGVKELKIENPFIQNKDYAQIVADYVLGYYKEPVRVLDMEILAVPHLQLGDLISITQFEDLGVQNKDYWVISSSINYDGGVKQNLSLRAYADTIDSPEFTFSSTPIPYTPSGGGSFYPTI